MTRTTPLGRAAASRPAGGETKPARRSEKRRRILEWLRRLAAGGPEEAPVDRPREQPAGAR